MKFTIGQKLQMAFSNLKDLTLPDTRPSVGFVVQEITGRSAFRPLDETDRQKVIQSLEASGYKRKDAEVSVAAFESAANINWSKHEPR